jgi:hypothetical protein
MAVILSAVNFAGLVLDVARTRNLLARTLVGRGCVLGIGAVGWLPIVGVIGLRQSGFESEDQAKKHETRVQLSHVTSLLR